MKKLVVLLLLMVSTSVFAEFSVLEYDSMSKAEKDSLLAEADLLISKQDSLILQMDSVARIQAQRIENLKDKI